MGRPVVDKAGLQFGQVTVVSPASNGEHGTAWNCVCSCGAAMVVPTNKLLPHRHVAACKSCAHVGDRTAAPVYNTVHKRLRSRIGPAAAYTCVDCPRQAQHWSHEPGPGFSMDPADYRPRCARCHRRHDFA